MTDNELTSSSEESTAPVTTVAQAVISKFLDELGKLEGFEDIAPRLRKTVLDEGLFSEPAIRAALFPDAP